jgi:hypothetical protein
MRPGDTREQLSDKNQAATDGVVKGSLHHSYRSDGAQVEERAGGTRDGDACSHRDIKSPEVHRTMRHHTSKERGLRSLDSDLYRRAYV